MAGVQETQAGPSKGKRELEDADVEPVRKMLAQGIADVVGSEHVEAGELNKVGISGTIVEVEGQGERNSTAEVEDKSGSNAVAEKAVGPAPEGQGSCSSDVTYIPEARVEWKRLEARYMTSIMGEVSLAHIYIYKSDLGLTRDTRSDYPVINITVRKDQHSSGIKHISRELKFFPKLVLMEKVNVWVKKLNGKRAIVTYYPRSVRILSADVRSQAIMIRANVNQNE